ncbi:hypothetical protein Y1Q_0009134 [Alligator mississippiensis]|uniref:Uncharacterized protein n=1 Tax=Alligator mississippiensis TaxID=8496 RepID=A0A151M2F8_ALLMI|nr:hypothetical protein Y1Q_0009134 [Alligator mississippiensis]
MAAGSRKELPPPPELLRKSSVSKESSLIVEPPSGWNDKRMEESSLQRFLKHDKRERVQAREETKSSHTERLTMSWSWEDENQDVESPAGAGTREELPVRRLQAWGDLQQVPVWLGEHSRGGGRRTRERLLETALVFPLRVAGRR